MQNDKGYTVKEMIILCAVLAIAFAIGISKVSYAYQVSLNASETEALINKNLYNAALAYINNNKDKFMEKETFIYGSELIENNLRISKKTFIVTANPETYMLSKKDDEMKSIIYNNENFRSVLQTVAKEP